MWHDVVYSRLSASMKGTLGWLPARRRHSETETETETETSLSPSRSLSPSTASSLATPVPAAQVTAKVTNTR